MANKEKLLASAQKSLQKGQVSRAIKDYRKLVDLDAEDVRIRQKLAELYARDHRIAEAMEEFGAVAKYYSDNGFFLKAIAVFKQILRLDPARVEIYHSLAELNEKQGLVGNALAEYRKLLAHYETHHNLSEAIEVLGKMKDLDPENLNIRVKIAETYAKDGLGEKAQGEFMEVLAILQPKEDHDKILELHEIFLPLIPGADSIELGMGQALIRTDRFDEGLAILQRHLEKDPGNIVILRSLALGYSKAGDFERAKQAYGDLLESSPCDLGLCREYVEACLQGGDYAGALRELEECKSAFLEGGMVSELEGYYESLRQALPEDGRAAATLSSIRRHAGGADAPEASGPFEEEKPCREVIEEVVEEIPDAEEEIPLDFLDQGEALQDEPVGGESREAPEEEEAPETQEDGEELELELELDLDLDLEEEPAAEEASEKNSPDSERALPLTLVDLGLDLDAALSSPAEREEEPSGPVSELEEGDLDLEEELAAAEISEESSLASEGAPALDLADLDLDAALSSPAEGEEEPFDAASELEEAEFYLQQGLLDEAEKIFRRLIERDPACGKAGERLEEIRASREGGKPRQEEGEDYFDLASEVLSEGFDLGDLGSGESGQGIDDETESHYNLGIAYKEMGLLDNAVAEFTLAGRSPARAVDCLTLKGICMVEKGSYDEAESSFMAGLEIPGITDLQRIGLHYELGFLYEAGGRIQEALERFESVADEDPLFRNADEKVRTLRESLGRGGGKEGESATDDRRG